MRDDPPVGGIADAEIAVFEKRTQAVFLEIRFIMLAA
jgi:hypothetical protein